MSPTSLLNTSRNSASIVATLSRAAACLLALGLALHSSQAANPTSGTLNPTGPNVTWDGTAPGGASADESSCVEGVNCETFTLTLSGTPADWTNKTAHVEIKWTDSTNDYDLFVHKGTNAGARVGSSATSGTTTESVDIDPNATGIGTGVFTVHVVYFAAVVAVDQYAGTASVVAGGTVPPTPTPAPTPTPPPIPGIPRYINYVSPPTIGNDSGEPSVGSNWLTEKIFSNSNGDIPNGGTATYYGGFSPDLLRITFDDCPSPADALWELKPLVLAATPRALGDPILFTDHDTGRTFVAQEEAQAGATTDYTDDDGETFQPSQGAGAPAGVDHETIGAGPFHSPAPATATYPHAVYYASQSVSDARTSRSDDGGVTFGPAVPMYTTADCGGLHGHIKVAPDGTVYVPNNACGGTTDPVGHVDGQQAAIVSEDNGLTWAIRPIPGSDTKSDRDPSIGIATDGTVYMGMQSKDGHARISVTRDKGLHWTAPFDVGAQLGIQNIVFPAVVAGDPQRAVFSFYGTTTAGDNYNQPEFPGVWFLYIATTFDGGQTWNTINATPGDPIQRGGICGSGTCRNLLDFFDATIDKEGRVLVGYDDGCIGGCVNGPPNSFSSKAVIARQSGGKRMFAQFDPVEPAIPGAPAASGTVDATNTKVTLTWPLPDNGGSVITSYNVYRRVGETGPFTKIATVQETNFIDTTFDKTAKNFYRVTAVDLVGEGPFCHEFSPIQVAAASPCATPGVLAVTDVNKDGSDNDAGQNTPADPRVNIRQLFLAEPFLGAGVDQLIFTLQMAPSTATSAPPNSQWYIVWNRQTIAADGSDRFYVAMISDATGAVTFEFGNFGPPIPTDGSIPKGNENTPTRLGAADNGSYDPATGLITINLSRSKAENIQPGKDLAGLNVRTYLSRPDPGQRSQNNASDITTDGTYTIVGNEACHVNQAPTAVLSASPLEGVPPLVVNFDASGSTDPDAGDSVASYTLDFGDGSDPVTQATSAFSHTYTRGGVFFAKLTVKDTHDLVSANIASLEIQTTATLLNISTRGQVQTGDNVLIGGLIITGNIPKRVILRAIGPSLNINGTPVAGRLADPTLELLDQNGVIASNDNWKDTQKDEIEATGVAPGNDMESAIVKTLAPGLYTAVVRGKSDGTGIALVEAYDLDGGGVSDSKLANISTRGLVGTDDNLIIGGFNAGPNSASTTKVVVRAIGPSLRPRLSNALNDPTLEIRNGSGTLIAMDDNWKDTQQSEIQASGLAPANDAESAILTFLEPGPYTVIVRGKDNTTGVGLVEIFDVR